MVDTFRLATEHVPDAAPPPPYPLEFRQRLIELVRWGQSPESLAREFEPSAPTIRHWVKQADLDESRRTRV